MHVSLQGFIFQFYISTIIIFDSDITTIRGRKFQFYISTIIIRRRNGSHGLSGISILHKYDYHQWRVNWKEYLTHFNST